MKVRSLVIVCIALALAGSSTSCGAPSGGARPKSDKLVKPDDLPARHRAVLEAWKKGGGAWEIKRDEVRADPELARFVVDNLMIEMVQAFDRSRLTRSGKSQGPFERAQAELVELHEHSTAVLVQSLTLKDGVVSFLAADTLAKIGASVVPDVMRLLDDENFEARRRAAELLGSLPPAAQDESRVMEALGQRVAKDSAWIVRAQAARALGARGAQAEHKGYAMGVLLKALTDEDASVAESAAIALGDLGERRAIPRIIDALGPAALQGRPGVVDALTKSLQKLSGTREPRDVEAWRRWWSAHEADVDAGKKKVDAPKSQGKKQG